MNTKVKVSERGRRGGESHPRAVLSDHEVELIRTLAEDMRIEGRTLAFTSKNLAGKFGVHPRTVVKYIYFESRAGQ